MTFGVEINEERLEIYAEHLSDLQKEQLERAFWRAVNDLNFFPKIAELREFAGALPSNRSDGRPGPEEAWARMPKGERMEDESIVWCEEERVAYGTCRGLLLDRDLIGARMAFKERYEREVLEARSQGKPVRWTMSAGYDIEHRLTTLAAAIQEKRISLTNALNFVPVERECDFAQMLPASEAKGLLLTGEVNKLPDLPGLAGILAKMRIEGIVPEELDSKPHPAQRTPADRSPDEVRQLRERAREQIEFLKRSRNGSAGRTI